LKELEKITNKPSADTLNDYTKRVDFLKQINNFNSTQKTNEKEVLHTINQLIPNPGPIVTSRDIKQKQIYHKSQLNKDKLLREQLLGKKNEDEKTQSSGDFNKLLAEHHESQEKIANEMIKSVRAIKENSYLANSIIKSDNKLLENLNSSAVKNSDNLKSVNDHLSERVSRSCNCWIWVMLFLIMMVFIMMVLFMKLFPKRRYATTSPLPSESTYTHFLNNNTLLIDNQTIHKIEL